MSNTKLVESDFQRTVTYKQRSTTFYFMQRRLLIYYVSLESPNEDNNL